MDTFPLKHKINKVNLTIEDDIIFFGFKKSTKIKIKFTLQILCLFIWICIIYNVYYYQGFLFFHEQTSLGTSIILTSSIWISGIIIATTIFFIKKPKDPSEYINKTTGDIKLYTGQKETISKIDDIKGIEVINYYERVRRQSNAYVNVGGYYKGIFHEVNLITYSNDRIPLFTNERKKIVYNNLNKISKFLNKPIIDHTKELIKDGESPLDKHIKASLVYTSCFQTNAEIIDDFLKKSKIEITKTSENTFSARTSFDSFTNVLNIPEELKFIIANITISDTKHSSLRTVKVKTNFRYELILILISFYISFSTLQKGNIVFIISTLVTVFLFIRVLNIRSDERNFMREIIIFFKSLD